MYSVVLRVVPTIGTVRGNTVNTGARIVTPPVTGLTPILVLTILLDDIRA